jgi:integrase
MTRRKTRRAGIEDLGGGWYRIRVRATDPRTGRRVEKDRRVHCRSIQEAKKLSVELRDAMEEEANGPPRARSKLGEHAAAWLSRRNGAMRPDGSARLSPTTRERYKTAIEHHIIPILGEHYVDKITARDVEDWRNYLSEHLASSTVNGLLNVLRSVLRDADNPVGDRVKALDVDDTRITDDEPNALDEEELQRFLEVAREHWEQHYAMLLVLFTTAVRISTLIALRWEDIDSKAGVIHFRRRRSMKEILPGVKRSRTSRDDVPLLPEVWTALEAHRAPFNEAQHKSGLVFPSWTGGYRARSVLNRVMSDIAKKAGIEKRFTPHGCRRTAAAFYRRVAGSVVSKAIAGHTTDEMHEHYAIVDASEKQDAARRAFGRLRIIKGG